MNEAFLCVIEFDTDESLKNRNTVKNSPLQEKHDTIFLSFLYQIFNQYFLKLSVYAYIEYPLRFSFTKILMNFLQHNFYIQIFRGASK